MKRLLNFTLLLFALVLPATTVAQSLGNDVGIGPGILQCEAGYLTITMSKLYTCET